MEVKVRLSETDQLGHINNVSYFIYLEEARLHFLQSHGLDFEKNDQVFLLASVSCDFIRQGYFGQKFHIDTVVSRVGTKSLTLTSFIHEKTTDRLIAKGTSTLVWFDMEKQVSAPIPGDLKMKLKQMEVEEEGER